MSPSDPSGLSRGGGVSIILTVPKTLGHRADTDSEASPLEGGTGGALLPSLLQLPSNLGQMPLAESTERELNLPHGDEKGACSMPPLLERKSSWKEQNWVKTKKERDRSTVSFLPLLLFLILLFFLGS